MTVVLRIRSHEILSQMLRWTAGALFVCGASLVAWCGYVVFEMWAFQQRQDAVLAAPALPPLNAPVPVAVPAGGLIGRVEIPRLGVSTIVMEGSDAAILRRAAGHIPGTRLPGEIGNTAISAHRETFFRPLRNIQQDDLIRMTTLQGEYSYRVSSTKIVNPDDVAVLGSDGSEVLTLVTCYPFYFIGSAPRRFIVRAERVSPLSTSR